MKYSGKNVAVLGAGLSGTAAADTFTLQGQNVTVGTRTVASVGVEDIRIDASSGADQFIYKGVDGVTENITIAASNTPWAGQIKIPSVAQYTFRQTLKPPYAFVANWERQASDSREIRFAIGSAGRRRGDDPVRDRLDVLDHAFHIELGAGRRGAARKAGPGWT